MRKGIMAVLAVIVTVFCFAAAAFAGGSAAVATPDVSFYTYVGEDGFHVTFNGWADFQIIKAEVLVENKLVGTIVPQRTNSRKAVKGVTLMNTQSSYQGDLLFTAKGSYIIGIKTYYSNSKRGFFYHEIRRVVSDMIVDISGASVDCSDSSKIVVEYYAIPMFGFNPTNGEAGRIQLGNYDYPAELECNYDYWTYCYTKISVDRSYYDTLIKDRTIDTFFRFSSFVSHTEIIYSEAGEYCSTE